MHFTIRNLSYSSITVANGEVAHWSEDNTLNVHKS